MGNKVPTIDDPNLAVRMYPALHKAIKGDLVASCHDLSDGGLGVALSESAFSGGFGAHVSLEQMVLHGVDRDDTALFSETPCRFLVSLRPGRESEFEEVMKSFPFACVGQVTLESRVRIVGLKGSMVIDADIWDLKRKWQAPLGL